MATTEYTVEALTELSPLAAPDPGNASAPYLVRIGLNDCSELNPEPTTSIYEARELARQFADEHETTTYVMCEGKVIEQFGTGYIPYEMPRRKPGRPLLRDEPMTRVEVRLPTALVAALDAATDNRTAFIERAIRDALNR